MRRNIARNIAIAAVLTLGATASAQAAEFSCSAKIGPPSRADQSGSMIGGVQANSKAEAEAMYAARVATVAAPVRAGRWVIHAVNCQPAK